MMCMWGVGVGLLQAVPSFANWYVISFPEVRICALTFCIVMLYLVHRIWWTMLEEKITNVGEFNVNLSPLALSCSIILLV